jgi:multiple sugar transport system permease protein
MSADRRWALRWSYFFLVLFASSSAAAGLHADHVVQDQREISAATNPCGSAIHAGNYIELLTSNQYLTFFRNSALVSVIVVTITMLIEVPAAFALAHAVLGSTMLAPIFLTY